MNAPMYSPIVDAGPLKTETFKGPSGRKYRLEALAAYPDGDAIFRKLHPRILEILGSLGDVVIKGGKVAELGKLVGDLMADDTCYRMILVLLSSGVIVDAGGSEKPIINGEPEDPNVQFVAPYEDRHVLIVRAIKLNFGAVFVAAAGLLREQAHAAIDQLPPRLKDSLQSLLSSSPTPGAEASPSPSSAGRRSKTRT